MDEPQLGESSIEEVVAALTTAEKVKLLRGTGMNLPLPDGSDGPTVGVSIEEQVPGAAGNTYAVERLGIPSIVMADGPAGVRIAPRRKGIDDRRFHATAFPIATVVAATWDVDVAEEVGAAMGSEARSYGVDVLLAPALNLQRFPLGGRNFEYYSEDPMLSGSMAAAAVRGVQSMGVGTSIKHFVANNHEWNRDSIDVQIDERTLRELYLRGFEIAVEDGEPWTVMSSYNKLNGEYTSESGWLLTRVLRDEWGFSGIVMTDWFGGRDPVGQMIAGNDLLMPGTDPQEEALLAAIKAGDLEESVLDRNVGNFLRLVCRTLTFKRNEYDDNPDLEKSAEVARRAAADGMVLLTNDDSTLPLSAPMRIALLGSYSYQTVIGGTGSGDVNEAYSVGIDAGLTAAGFVLDEGLAAAYRQHLEEFKASLPKREGIQAFLPEAPLPELGIDRAELERATAGAEIVIMTIGRASGEFVDRETTDFELRDIEIEQLRALHDVCRTADKRLVVLLNIGGPIATSLIRELADAALVVWQPGQEGGNAVADIVSGRVNPSGKLPATFAAQLSDHPQAEQFPGRPIDPAIKPSGLMGSVPAVVEYDEGFRVGYRAFTGQAPLPAFAFGHGLSYSSFDYHELSLTARQDEFVVEVTVENVGAVPGRDVVQIYVSAPQGQFDKPEHELRAYAKTGLLDPGSRQRIALRLDPKRCASFDPERGRWVLEAGAYEVRVGTSAADIVARKLFELAEPRHFDP